MQEVIEIILLVKFTLLSKYKENGDQSLLYVSFNSLKECYSQGEYAFNKINILNSEELLNTYFRATIKLRTLVEKLKDIMFKEDDEMQDLWKKAENGEFNMADIEKILENNDWQKIVPFAIHSNSNDILYFIANKIKDLDGYEYILRIISQNEYIEENTEKLLLSSKLPEKYKEKLRNK